MTTTPDTTADDRRTALVLHGGGGPGTVAGLAAHLARDLRVLAPTHPGWDGTPRPAEMTGIPALADSYRDLLAESDLRDVLVVGSSIGGWLAAELASRDRDGRIGALILIDTTGIDVPGHPIRDFFALDARGVAEYGYHDADRFFVDPATLPAEELARRAANMATLKALAGDPAMHDPTLAARLADIRVPTLVLWGAADRIVTPDYGRAFAAAVPGARFEVVPEAGHLPQLEQPAATFAAVDAFIRDRTGAGWPA